MWVEREAWIGRDEGYLYIYRRYILTEGERVGSLGGFFFFREYSYS